MLIFKFEGYSYLTFEPSFSTLETTLYGPLAICILSLSPETICIYSSS